jgi:hypothetical protein
MLAERWNEHAGVFYPVWTEERPTRVYDQFAQAAGY